MRFSGNRGFFMIAGAVLGLLFFLGLARDLLLDRKTAPPVRESPPIIVEGLEVYRDVDGDKWQLKAENVVKRGVVSDAEDLFVVVDSSGGTVWTIRSESGLIFEEAGDVLLESAAGNVDHSGGKFQWTAPRADWDPKRSMWIFPEGFEARDEKLLFSGKKGGMTMAGAVRVEEGAVVTWKDPAR
ncbi:MAG: hypothetical protein RQ767_03335 [Thermovirgaceae bacterium]|nr:hypothetical protein [Thermovirgaceae bacterium]